MDETEISIAVILPAAGQSRRFQAPGGKPQSKLSVEIGRKAILQRAVELFLHRKQIRQIIVAGDPDEFDTFKFRWNDTLGLLGATLVPGGRTERWETVMNALQAVGSDITHIAVHDAARPVTDAATIDRVIEAARYHDAIVPGLPVHETLKSVEADARTVSEADPLDAVLGGAGKKTVQTHRVIQTVARDNLWTAQTPQLFKASLLREAYDQLSRGTLDAGNITDDAGLVEAMGEAVHIVRGDPMNVKVTTPADVPFAEAVLAARSGKPAGDTIGAKRKHPTWAQMSDDA